MCDFKIINFERFISKGGELIACEFGKNCPFEIKRAFYIFNMDSANTRGTHANKESSFLFIALNGSLKIKIDDGIKSKIFKLDSPRFGLFLNKMMWKEMFEFSHDCVLLVLCDKKYNKNEYINDYEMFKTMKNPKRGGCEMKT